MGEDGGPVDQQQDQRAGDKADDKARINSTGDPAGDQGTTLGGQASVKGITRCTSGALVHVLMLFNLMNYGNFIIYNISPRIISDNNYWRGNHCSNKNHL